MPPGKKGDRLVDAYETINDILVNLFNEILKLEEEAIITEEFKDITNNDMHIIEAIGLSGENTMSVVAKKLGITAGSLTTSINSLVNKKYVVISVPSKEDDNPEHIHLLTKDILTKLFAGAGCTKLHFGGVNSHLIMMATIE